MSSSAAVLRKKNEIDAWLSLVERCVRDAEVAGSNPVASTLGRGAGKSKGFPVFLCRKKFGRALRSGRRGSQGPVDLGFEPTEAGAETAGSNPVASILGRGAEVFEKSNISVFLCKKILHGAL